jgi:hypothetical protein
VTFDKTYLTKMPLSIYMFRKNRFSVRRTLLNGENKFYLYFLRFRPVSKEKDVWKISIKICYVTVS